MDTSTNDVQCFARQAITPAYTESIVSPIRKDIGIPDIDKSWKRRLARERYRKFYVSSVQNSTYYCLTLEDPCVLYADVF